MIRLCYAVILTSCIACMSSKSRISVECSRQYQYSSKKLDLKGITYKLKKEGVDVADVGIGEISIDPRFVVASEKLQQLDLLQYSLCQQIRSFSKTDTAAKSLQLKYASALIDMMKIAQNQDSASKK